MNRYKVYKFFFWIILTIGFLINIEPAFNYLILGKIPEMYLSSAWKPGWLFPLFGLLSLVNIIFLIFMIKGKAWAAFALGVIAIPHAFPIYFIAERVVIAPAIYILPTILVIVFFFLARKNQVQQSGVST
jgi:hypothetical protein